MEPRYASRQSQDRFLAVLAHELRSPLAPIKTALEALARAADDPRTVSRVHDIIERQLAQLTRLVNDLSEIGQIAHGQIELCREEIELTAVVAAAIETSQPLLEARAQKLAVAFTVSQLSVVGDAGRLTQVFANILNNASKYTPRNGQVFVSVECDDGWAVVRVKDTGIGIAPEMLQRVFEMFVQVEPHPQETLRGLGIGLALARQLIEAHGGTVEARSDGLGRGSEFLLRLPLAASDRPSPHRACATRPMQTDHR